MNSSYPRSRFLYLLISLFLLIGAGPFLSDYVRISLITDLCFFTIFLSAIFSISHEKYRAITAISLATPVLFMFIGKYFLDLPPEITLVGDFCTIFFIAYILYIIISFISSQGEVTREVLHAAIIVYLLFGILWSGFYMVLDKIQPGSFNVPAGSSEGTNHYIYYSFVTLTTLGYGDMTPITAKARSLSMIEAVIGQIYLVIQMAWLVGMYTSRSFHKRINARKASGLKNK